MFITRKQYDLLLLHCPSYMQSHYLKLKRKWSIGGVTVTGTPAQITLLEKRIRWTK